MPAVLAIAVSCAPADPRGPPAPGALSLVGTATLVPPPELAPLSWRIDVTTPTPTTATLTVQTDEAAWSVQFPARSTAHALPVLDIPVGLAAEAHVVLRSDDGDAWKAGPFAFEQAPLPADWPEVELTVHMPDRMEPGRTLTAICGDDRKAMIVALDDSVRPTWLLGPLPQTLAMEWRGDHVAVLQWLQKRVAEFDVFGTELRTIGPEGTDSAITVPGTVAFHHELVDLPDGTHVVLDRQPVRVDDYPGSYTDPTVRLDDVEVGVERLVHFDDAGGVIDMISMDEIYDLGRIGYGSLIEDPYGLEWVHHNAVLYDAAHDAWILSSRHQDAIASVDRTTHALRWLVAPDVNWAPAESDLVLRPEGPFVQPYHQHAPQFSPTGSLLVFDNGNARADPWTGVPQDADPNSIATELVIDEGTGTVRQPWSFEPPDAPIWSGAMGSVLGLPITGNRLIDYAYVASVGGVNNAEMGLADTSVRLVEVAMPDEVVWDVRLYLYQSEADPVPGLWAYRAERIPQLYPDDHVIQPL